MLSMDFIGLWIAGSSQDRRAGPCVAEGIEQALLGRASGCGAGRR